MLETVCCFVVGHEMCMYGERIFNEVDLDVAVTLWDDDNDDDNNDGGKEMADEWPCACTE